MAGLTAAYRLRQARFSVTVFEQETAVGGRTRSVTRNGFLFDLGAITLSPRYTRTIELLREVGAGGLLETLNPVFAIAREGRLHEIDLGQPFRSLRKRYGEPPLGGAMGRRAGRGNG
jgi:oxygen-dependent protoporphyrinogen oxidase